MDTSDLNLQKKGCVIEVSAISIQQGEVSICPHGRYCQPRDLEPTSVRRERKLLKVQHGFLA
jgi:hypothetical protein